MPFQQSSPSGVAFPGVPAAAAPFAPAVVAAPASFAPAAVAAPAFFAPAAAPAPLFFAPAAAPAASVAAGADIGAATVLSPGAFVSQNTFPRPFLPPRQLFPCSVHLLQRLARR
jgi:hypothetical protein